MMPTDLATPTLSLVARMPKYILEVLKTSLESIDFDRHRDDDFDLDTFAPSSLQWYRRHRIDYMGAKERKDYARLEIEASSVLDHYLKREFPGYSFMRRQAFFFDGYCVMPHDDAPMEDDPCPLPQLQLMLIANNGGHLLWSGGESLAPKAGDIVELDVHAVHALTPPPGMKADEAARTPLRFYAVPFERREYE